MEYISITDGNYKGLFGLMVAGKIQNLGIKESYIQGNAQVGGILGFVHYYARDYIIIENCYNEGTIVGTNSDTGGICGMANKINLINCYNTGNIKGKTKVGGIIGGNAYGTIENCYNTGTVSQSGEYSSCQAIGGIIGESGSYDGIKNCYNTGDIIGLKATNNVGGIKGTGHGAIENCYNTGNIIGHGYVGGISGYNGEDIKNCYNKGNVSGYDYVGGISGSTWNIENCYNIGKVVGERSSGGVTYFCNKVISNTYYLEGTADFGDGYKKSNTNAEPKTEDEIKALTATLNTDLENAIWIEDTIGINEGYPLFVWQLERFK